jgi:hypothetical protein
MAVQYRNTISGMVVTLDAPDRTYDNHPRWRRVEGDDAGGDAAAAPFTTGARASDPAAPAGNASTEEWQAYAIARGMPAEEANTATRKELRERYG